MKRKVEPIPPIEIDHTLREIGSRLRAKRRSISRNYETFAKERNYNKVTILKIERAEREYYFSSLITFARLLDMPLEELFKGIR
jgi:transcriptional regulator with XRE-family HTH domain